MFKENNTYGKGRTKGSNNKVTLKIKEAFSDLLENNLSKLQDDLDELEPRDRLKMLIDLSGFILPRLKAIEIDNSEVINSQQDDFLEKLLDIDEENYTKL